MTDAVRPTKRCLADLGCEVPNLGTRLSSLSHPLIVKAQSLPAQSAAGGAERVKVLTDRVWLKVKVDTWRGVASNLRGERADEFSVLGAHWWLGAAGIRQGDSAHHDFYSVLGEEAHRAGKNTCSTDSLLPNPWDMRRLHAEAAVNAQLILERVVRAAAAQSLLNSDTRTFLVGDRDVRVRIRVQDDGQAYIVIGATGSLDPQFFVALVSAIPGVPVDDWMPEPGGPLKLELGPGEIVWSAMMSAGAQQELLNFA